MRTKAVYPSRTAGNTERSDCASETSGDEAGCDYGQGDLFGPVQPAGAIN